ncbi:MAG TPA: signal peptide peptidase SppA [Oculatellaceae cyanobacterium]|jgi:protease-4
MAMTPRHIALGILAVSLCALLVGIFNAARLTERGRTAASGSVSGLLSQRNRLALIELSGLITMDEVGDKGLFRSESNAVLARKALDEAAKDDGVKGVLLHINSPGGTVGMSQELNAAVKRVSAKKPIVVSMGDLTASGGYYTACAADRIFANPGTLTASIGVIISSMDLSSLLNQKLGVQAVTIKSGKFKDILSPYRKPQPDELALVQKLVNQSYQDFLDTVIEGRTRFITDPKQKAERIAKLKAVADGRVVSGREALASGLVDELGDLDKAYTALDAMAKKRFKLKGKDRLPLESSERPFNLMEVLGLAPSASATPAAQLSQLLPVSMRYPNQPLWVME